MGYIIRMPKLGLEMEEGVLLEWTVDEGDHVSEGDQLAEVESEKSIGEVDAREDGVLRHVYVEEGERVPPSTPIGILAAPDVDISELRSEAESDIAEQAPSVIEATADAGAETSDSDGSAAAASGAGGQSAATATEEESADVKASPRAEKRADELGVDLTTVDGTGPQGSITADDVEAAAEDGASTAESEAESQSDEVRASPRAKKRADELGVDLTSVDGTGPGGAITEEDVETAAETTTAEPDEAAGVRRVEPDDVATVRYERETVVVDQSAATALFETVEAVRGAFEERVTMTDVLLVVASAALSERPRLNATYAEGTHHLQDSQHVALAVEVDGETTADVIPDVRDRSLTSLVETRQHLDGSEHSESDERATFTLVNAADAESEGLLVNEPAVAALEVDPTGQRAVPDGDGIDLRPLVTVSLTYDTRAIDATDAKQFLDSFVDHADRAAELVLETYRDQA